MRVLALYGLFLGPAVLAVAQAPLVEPGGVVDAASFKGPVREVSVTSEPSQRRPPAAAVGIDLPTPTVSRHRAGPGAGAAVAGGGVSSHSRPGQEGGRRDLLWRRSGRAQRQSRGNDLGDQGPNPGGAAQRPARFGQYDLGGKRAWQAAFHADPGQGQRRRVCGVSPPPHAPCRAARLSDPGWRQLSSQPAGARLRGQPGRQVAAVLSAALLAGAEPGRASLELREAPWRGQGGAGRSQGTDAICQDPPAILAKAALDYPHVLSYLGHSICSPLTPYWVCPLTYELVNTRLFSGRIIYRSL